MIIIHQAIYGEVQGRSSGHDLLAASDEKKELFRRVSGHTDLADRPEGTVLRSPVVRGLFVEDHFLLIKTFPDKGPGLRSGRVFSHVLFIPKSDLQRVHNLSSLFEYHLSCIKKEATMYPLEYISQETIKNTAAAVDGREAAATNALLENQPVVWLGQEGYWEWVARIWPNLPAKMKCSLKIGAAFSPSYFKEGCLSLLYIPEEAKIRWERHAFRVLGADESQTLRSPAANWLIGDIKAAALFQVLLDDFAPKIDSIGTINRLEDYGAAYYQIGKNPDFNRLLLLAHFISKISPSEKVGVKGKSRLQAAIVQAIPDIPKDMFIALMYQDWKGFPDAINSISGALRDWLTKNLLKGKQAKDCGAVVLKALESDVNNWWGNAVLNYTNERLIERQSADAQILWHWIKDEPALTARHTSWLPDDAENELARKIPKMEASVAEAVLGMAEEKYWFVLHAKVAAQLYSAEKAIAVQLRIDTDEGHTAALQALSKSIKDGSFVQVAAEHTDARLHRIVGKLIAKDSKLISGIDITSEGWQKCWEAVIEQGCDVWLGISNPQRTLFEILDHMLAGNSFNKALLDAISIGRYSSLKSYPQRPVIWRELPERARSNFVSATLVDMIDELVVRKIDYNDLEGELKNEVESQRIQQKIVISEAIPVAKKIKLFDVLAGFKEHHARELMQGNRFLLEEADKFGRLVSKYNWRTVAKEMYERRSRRDDLLPALLQCSHLLGRFQRFMLSASGLKRDAISSEEWWQEFFETAVTLFPSGPEENGLWTSAGGDLSQLYTAGTGREKWGRAVHILRNNESRALERLLSEMCDSYSANEMLKKLKETL